MKEDKTKDEQTNIPKITADFQSSVCGAIFTTDEDRKQHLEKEGHGQVRDDETSEDMEIAEKQEELDESRPYHNIKSNISYGQNKKEQEIQLEQQPNQIDWQKIIGMTIRSKDNLDMGTVIVDDDKDYLTSNSVTIEYGDRERLSIPKEDIYKRDKNLYTTLTENEILASRADDPFYTSMRSYVRD
jgi:hypothetical protein